MTKIIFENFKQFLLNLVFDFINRKFFFYEKFENVKQLFNQKIFVFKIYLKKTKFHLFEFIETYRTNFFLIKLNAKLKCKILNINKMFNIREKSLIKIIMQKKILKRTRSNDENYSTQFKFFKDFFNKSKKLSNKSNDHFNSQFFSQREIDVNNQREIRDNIKRKRERDKIARFKNVICYDCNEKNHYKFDCFYQQKKQ